MFCRYGYDYIFKRYATLNTPVKIWFELIGSYSVTVFKHIFICTRFFLQNKTYGYLLHITVGILKYSNIKDTLATSSVERYRKDVLIYSAAIVPPQKKS